MRAWHYAPREKDPVDRRIQTPRQPSGVSQSCTAEPSDLLPCAVMMAPGAFACCCACPCPTAQKRYIFSRAPAAATPLPILIAPPPLLDPRPNPRSSLHLSSTFPATIALYFNYILLPAHTQRFLPTCLPWPMTANKSTSRMATRSP